MEQRAPEAVIDGDDGPMREAGELQLRFNTLSKAVEAVEKRYEPPKLELQRAIAPEKRDQAAAKTRELETLNRKTETLLAKLSGRRRRPIHGVDSFGATDPGRLGRRVRQRKSSRVEVHHRDVAEYPWANRHSYAEEPAATDGNRRADS